MPDWFQAAIGGAAGLVLIGCVFWFAFGRAPSRRSDGGLTNDHGATADFMRNDGSGHHS